MPELSVSGAALGALAATAVFATLVRGAWLAFVYPLCLVAALGAGVVNLVALLGGTDMRAPAARPAVHRTALTARRLVGVLRAHRDQSRRAGGQPLRHGLRPRRSSAPRVEPFFAAVRRRDEPRADRRRCFRLPVFLGADVAHLLGAGGRAPDDAGKPHRGASLSGDGGDGHRRRCYLPSAGMQVPAGGYAFDDDARRSRPSRWSPAGVSRRLSAAGSKAGIVPLHAWLPLAHPAAPSHVSALMSGVMTKVAIYGIIRIVFDLLGAPAWWWALPFIVLGAADGRARACSMRCSISDLKRVLAYSTIENIGVIFVGTRAGARLQEPPACTPPPRSPWPRRCCTASIIPGSSRCSSSAPVLCCTPRGGAISTGLAD